MTSLSVCEKKSPLSYYQYVTNYSVYASGCVVDLNYKGHELPDYVIRDTQNDQVSSRHITLHSPVIIKVLYLLHKLLLRYCLKV